MRQAELSPGLADLCALLDGRSQTAGSSPGELIALARRHRVEPLLHVRLAAGNDELARDYRENVQRVLRSLAWLQRLLQALAGEGIEARPLKGLPLAAQAYERIADRHCGDLDLLVDGKGQRERVDAVVRSLGLRPQAHARLSAAARRVHVALYKEDCYLSPDGLVVELHYRQGGMGPYVFPSFLAFGSAAWEACRVETVRTHRLHGAPLMLYLFSHGARCRWHRLKWLLDLRRLTREYDASAWGELHAAARGESLALQVGIGSRILRSAFGAPSVDKRKRSVQFAFRECMIDMSREAESPDSVWRVACGVLYSIVVQRGWRARIAVIGRETIRVPDIARWRLPLPLVLALAPIARPISLLYRRALRPLARRMLR